MDDNPKTPKQEIIPASSAGTPLTLPIAAVMPEIVRSAGPAATFAWDEFFAGRIRNPHTRAAYLHAVGQFLNWAEGRVDGLTDITPGLIGSYFGQHPSALPTRKLLSLGA